MLPGAAEVRIWGERLISMRINLDRTRLAGYGLTVQDVEDAVRRQNAEIPAGRIESTAREFTVVAETDVRTPEQFEKIIVANVSGYPVRIRDLGTVAIGAVDERTISRFNGKPSLNIGVIKQAVANPLDLSKAVRAEVTKINENLPSGMKLVVAYDTSTFIERAISSVFTTIIEAIVLVVLVIFFFLRSLRATIIPIVTIPVSLIGAFALMYGFGFTVNTLTLLAMVLAIGLVVDDAIVVLENIFRHMEEGMTRMQAAMQGSREIAFAVVAMTLTLASVFAPLAFATGRTGRLFIEFALTLAGAVMVSGFVALTLDADDVFAAAAARDQALLDVQQGRDLPQRPHQGLPRPVDGCAERALDRHPGMDRHAGCRRPVVHLAQIGALADRGSRPHLRAGDGAAGRHAAYTSDQLRPLEEIYSRIPEAFGYTVISGFPTVVDGTTVLRLKPWEERTKKQQQIAEELRPQLAVDPRRPGLPDQSALAGTKLPLHADRVRDHGAGALCRTAAPGRPVPGRSAQVSRARTTCRPTFGSIRPRCASASTATSSATSASTSIPSAGRWRRCWAVARSRASSATANSTT